MKHGGAGPAEQLERAAPRPPRHRQRRLAGWSDLHGPDDLIALDLAAESVPRESQSIECDVQRKGDVGAAQRHSLENLAAVTGAGDPLDRLEVLFDDGRVAKPPACDA